MICSECTTDISMIADSGSGRGCPSCGGEVLLAGEYSLLELIGQNRWGKVFRAMRVTDGESVAINQVGLTEAVSHRVERLEPSKIPGHVDSFVDRRGGSDYFYLIREFASGGSFEFELPGQGRGQRSGAMLLIIATSILSTFVLIGVALFAIVSPPTVGESDLPDGADPIPGDELSVLLNEHDDEFDEILESVMRNLEEDLEAHEIEIERVRHDAMSEEEEEALEEEQPTQPAQDEDVEQRPQFAERKPVELGPFRLGMSVDEARAAVPAEGSWRRGTRGRPMPPGETWRVETPFVGEEMDCSVHFCEVEGICSLRCRMHVVFAVEDHRKVTDELVELFRGAYGSETRYFFRRGSNEKIYWWTHPESELVLRAAADEVENIRDSQGYSTKRIRLDSAYYEQWHEEDERRREENR